MQKIIPHFWFTSEAKEATEFYATLFSDSCVHHVTEITGTPSGNCDVVTFTLAGQEFMAISAGHNFKLNPSASLFVVFETEAEIAQVWNRLVDGGKVLMPFDTYPWAKKYGWLQDRYGLSWQLSLSEHHLLEQKITPFLMFAGSVAGKTKEAIETYTRIFPHSQVEMLVPYGKGENDIEGFIKHARCTLGGVHLMAMDSSFQHDFTFTEAMSFVVNCDTQDDIDYYWEKLSAVPEAEQCGWLKDKYGVSWQIVPSNMSTMMTSGDTEKIARVSRACLNMKKMDMAMLKKAYDGE